MELGHLKRSRRRPSQSLKDLALELVEERTCVGMRCLQEHAQVLLSLRVQLRVEAHFRHRLRLLRVPDLLLHVLLLCRSELLLLLQRRLWQWRLLVLLFGLLWLLGVELHRPGLRPLDCWLRRRLALLWCLSLGRKLALLLHRLLVRRPLLLLLLLLLLRMLRLRRRLLLLLLLRRLWMPTLRDML